MKGLPKPGGTAEGSLDQRTWVAMPGGFIDGLPVAFQLVGRPYEEETVFRLAAAFERATDYRNLLPPVLEKAS